MKPTVLIGFLLAALIGACNPQASTKFPPGLEPVDPQNLAADPAAQGGDHFPETINFERGSGTANGQSYAWVHGRGYIKAPIGKIWQAFQVADAVTDRRNVDEWSATPNVESGYRISFRVHQVVHALFDVSFETTWRQDVASGENPDLPNTVVGAWQKTDGTTYIYLLAGSFLLRKVDAQTTEVQLMEHLAAYGKSADSAQSFLQDMFANVTALAHDQPVPKVK